MRPTKKRWLVLAAAAVAVAASGAAGCLEPVGGPDLGSFLGRRCAAAADCPYPLDCLDTQERDDGGAVQMCTTECQRSPDCDFTDAAVTCGHFWRDAGMCLRVGPSPRSATSCDGGLPCPTPAPSGCPDGGPCS